MILPASSVDTCIFRVFLLVTTGRVNTLHENPASSKISWKKGGEIPSLTVKIYKCQSTRPITGNLQVANVPYYQDHIVEEYLFLEA